MRGGLLAAGVPARLPGAPGTGSGFGGRARASATARAWRLRLRHRRGRAAARRSAACDPAEILGEVGLAPARRLLERGHRLVDVAFLRSDEKPWAMPAATPETFSTGFAIAWLTARTAVSALSAIETALSVTVSALSSW